MMTGNHKHADLHTIVASVQDHPGVLNRVSSLFRRRMFNIDSLTVGHTSIEGISRMTVVVDAAITNVQQVMKQLSKLIEIIDVFEVTPQSAMCHELALIKLSTEDASHDVIASIVDTHQARLVHRGAASILIEATGPSARLDNLVDQLRPLGIREMVRTGAVAMTLD